MTDHWSAPPTSSLPQPPSPPPPDNRRSKAIIGAAVALLLAIAVGLTVGLLRDDDGPQLVGDDTAAPPAPAGDAGAASDDGGDPDDGSADDGDDAADDGDASDGETPPSTTAPDVSDVEAELAALLPTLVAFVEQERGLEFQQEPTVVVLDDDAFVDRFNALLDEDFEEDAADWEIFTGIFHALDILAPDVTLEDANRAFGESGVLGYYDPETDELVVRGGSLSPLVRTTVVHELVHALDDQWFDLERLEEFGDRPDEIGFGFRSVVEGNARYIEARYRDTLSDQERAEEEQEGLALSDDVDFSALTFPFVELQFAPYEYGELLIDELWADGQATVDGAFESPPDTSEQVIVTGAFRAGEGRLEVAPPPADGEVIEEGVFGQLLLQTILATAVDEDDAQEAAGGWAGDWFVAWNDGDDTCLRADVVMDDETERDELAAALGSWVDDRDDASLELTGDDRVRFTTCG